MGYNEILKYVMNTPHNTNPNVLKGMLQQIDSGSNNNIADEVLESTTINLINSTATRVASQKFYNFTALQTISCNNVQQVGASAFLGCTKLSQASFPKATNLGDNAFTSSALISVDFPNVTRIGYGLFMHCSSLTTAKFINATAIVSYAFADCISLTDVQLPKLSAIGTYVFQSCTTLSTIAFPAISQIGSSAFYNCSNLRSLYLLSNAVVNLNKLNAFNGTPIASDVTTNPGSIYVPASLYSSYLIAPNWSNLSSRFVSLSSEEVENLL